MKETERVQSESQISTSQTSSRNIGISGLMDKRLQLDKAIDYVGLMIKNLKEKRTTLEKDIEDESEKILSEAAAVAGASVNEKFPTTPTEQSLPSSTNYP